MEISLLPRILAFAVLMCLSAFFSASEVALFSLRSSRLEQLKTNGVAVARVISDLLARPRRLLISILIGNESVNLAASTLVASMVIYWLGPEYKWLAVVIMTPILMVFGEITPKSIALRRPEMVSRWVARPISGFAVLSTPLRWVFRSASDRIIRALGGGRQMADNILSEDEFRTLVDMGHEVGELEDQERKLIHNVFEFGDTLVSEIMMPRSEIFLLSYQMEVPRILDAIREHPLSRIPVYRHHPANVVGILHTKDLLPLARGEPGPKSGRRLPLREPYFVPPGKKVSDLFNEFKRKKTHMALVVDEFGDLAGLVTLEDVLEELFEDLPAAPAENEKGNITTLEEGGYLISARTPVQEVETTLGRPLAGSPSGTLGEFVTALFGRTPKAGERIGKDGWFFTVAEMRAKRILNVRVETPGNGEGSA